MACCGPTAPHADSLEELLAATDVDLFERLRDNRRAPGVVVTLNQTDTLEKALSVLSKNHILSAPVVAAQGTSTENGTPYSGILDVVDVLAILLAKSGELASKNASDEGPAAVSRLVEYHERKEDFWREMAGYMTLKVSIKSINRRNPIVPLTVAKGEALPTLADCVPHFGNGIHRVVVYNKDEARITAVISQFALLHYVAGTAKRRKLLDGLDVKLTDTDLLHKYVIRAAGHVSALDAFKAMYKGGVPAVALVDDDARLFGVLSASDLRNLNKSNYQSLNQPVLDFIAEMRGGEPTAVLSINQDDTVGVALQLVVDNHMHRIFVVDKLGRPTGIVTLTDFIRYLCPFCQFGPVYNRAYRDQGSSQSGSGSGSGGGGSSTASTSAGSSSASSSSSSQWAPQLGDARQPTPVSMCRACCCYCCCSGES